MLDTYLRYYEPDAVSSSLPTSHRLPLTKKKVVDFLTSFGLSLPSSALISQRRKGLGRTAEIRAACVGLGPGGCGQEAAWRGRR
jgi:hypothetical protein